MTEALLLLIPAGVIMLLLSPVMVQARVTFNLQSKSGVISLYIYGINILYYIFQIEGKNIVLTNKRQTKEKSLSLENNDLLFVKILLAQVKDKTRLKMLYVFYNLGAGDAFASAMLGGILNVFVLTFFTTIKSKKPTASLGIYDTISYNKSIFEIALKGKITISFVDIAYSFINSVILTWKAKAGEKPISSM